MATGTQHSTCSLLPSQPALGYSVLVGRLSLLLFGEADETSWVREGKAVRHAAAFFFFPPLQKVLLGHIKGPAGKQTRLIKYTANFP